MDYNYPNSYGESSQELYTHTYSLWNSSKYYNTNELSPRNFFVSSQVEQTVSQPPFTPEAKPKREIVRDIYNRRIITKVSLYNEPELFYEPENEPKSIYGPPSSRPETSAPQPSQLMPPRDEWTDGYWRRAVGSCSSSQNNEFSSNQGHNGIGNVRRIGKEQRFKKKFMDALAQPLKSSKAESMMQKMGWAGGALGKGGHGIVEPIAPNVDYAQTTLGFGNRTEAHSPKKKLKQCGCQKNGNNQKTKKQRKEDFVTNTLLYILEFVRNDWESEITFDIKFTSKERRIIHQCVNEIINECDDELYAGEQNVVKITNAAQERVLQCIREYNCYVLYTESHGVMPNRQLCLYKDAPEHVYLVTPDDFKEDADKGKEPVQEELEDNPFLKSITRNLKPDDEEFEEPTDNAGRLTKYFREFARDDAYSEFRFLGPFDADETECLNVFLNEVAACVAGDGSEEKLTRIVNRCSDENIRFELLENCNGSIVIHKRKKDAET